MPTCTEWKRPSDPLTPVEAVRDVATLTMLALKKWKRPSEPLTPVEPVRTPALSVLRLAGAISYASSLGPVAPTLPTTKLPDV